MKNNLENNFNIEKGSFMFKLHWEKSFSYDLFLDLLKSIINDFGTSQVKPELIFKIYKLQFWILSSFLFHLDTNDLYNLKKAPKDISKITNLLDFVCSEISNPDQKIRIENLEQYLENQD